jgi:hypothetical protein
VRWDEQMGSGGNGESFADAVARIEQALRNRSDPEAACVTVVAERASPDVLAAFLVPRDAGPVKAGRRLRSGARGVSVLVVAGGAVAVEDDGFTGSSVPALERLSIGTRAASVFWNGVGDFAVGFARDGVVLDGSADGFPTGDVDPEVAVALAGLDPEVHDQRSCALVAVERFTGVRIDGAPPSEPVEVYEVPDPKRLMPALGVIRKATLVHSGDEDRSALAGAIAALTPRAQRRLAASTAHTILGLTGQRDDPGIAEAVEWLVHPHGPRFSEPVEIAILRANSAESRGVVNARLRALRILATAANPDAHLAALESVWATRALLTPEALARFDAGLQEFFDQRSGSDAQEADGPFPP